MRPAPWTLTLALLATACGPTEPARSARAASPSVDSVVDSMRPSAEDSLRERAPVVPPEEATSAPPQDDRATPAPRPNVPAGPIERCDAAASGGPARVREGIVYGRAEGRDLSLDLGLPAGDGPHPWVLVIHGGAWRAGERAHVRHELEALARHGYAAAAVDHRLVEGTRGVFPAAMDDLRCAVRFLRREAADLELDPERGAAMGYSSGAHLALLLGVGADQRVFDQSCADRATSPAVQAVVAFYPPVDLRADAPIPRSARRLVSRLLGGSPEARPDLARLASPIALVDAGDAPTLLVHGTEDITVPVEHSRRMQRALADAHVPVTYVEVVARHGFRLFPQRSRIDAPTCTTLAFLEATLGG